MQDGCKVYVGPYMASNGSCFMVTWTIFNNHLLEVGLTQNQETMAFQTLTTIHLIFYLSSVRIRMNRNSLKKHLVEVLVAYDFTPDLRTRDHTT